MEIKEHWERTVTPGMPPVCRFRQRTAGSCLFMAYEQLRVVEIVAGCGEWQIEQECCRVGPGALLLFHDRERRRLTADPSCGEITLDVITFSPLALYPYPDCAEAFFSRAGGAAVMRPGDAGYTDVHSAFHRLGTELARWDFFSSAGAYGALLQLGAAVGRFYSAPGRPGTDRVAVTDFRRIADAAAFLRARYADPVTVGEAAAAAGMPQQRFSALFVRLMGVSATAFLRRVRVRAVMDRLQAGGETVLDAALACGFGSSAGFYKALHAVTGSGRVRRAGDFQEGTQGL